jgi:hypothetical protein
MQAQKPRPEWAPRFAVRSRIGLAHNGQVGAGGTARGVGAWTWGTVSGPAGRGVRATWISARNAVGSIN